MLKEKTLKILLFLSEGNISRYLQVFIFLALLIGSLLFPEAALANPQGGGVGN